MLKKFLKKDNGRKNKLKSLLEREPMMNMMMVNSSLREIKKVAKKEENNKTNRNKNKLKKNQLNRTLTTHMISELISMKSEFSHQLS